MPKNDDETSSQYLSRRFSRLNRRMRAVRFFGLAPTPAKSRKVHETVMILSVFFLYFFLYGDRFAPDFFAAYIGDFWRNIGIGLSAFLLGASTFAFLGILYLYNRQTELHLVGYKKPFPFFPGRFRTVRSYGLQGTETRKENGKLHHYVDFKIVTFEKMIINFLAGASIPLTRVVVIAEVLDKSYSERLRQEFMKTGEFEDSPSKEASKNLTCMIKVDEGKYLIPGPPLIRVLGNRNVHYDQFDFLRDWAWEEDTEHDLNPTTFLIIVTDTLPLAKDLEHMEKFVFGQNQHWIAEDLSHDLDELKRRHRASRVEKRGDEELQTGGGVDLEEP